MSIDVKEIERISKIARIELTEQEVIALTEQINSIMDYTDKINKLNTDNVEATSHILDLQNVTRSDEVEESLSIDNVLSNAKVKEDGYFKVPVILE